MENCTCSYVGLPCEHAPNRGRTSQLPCPSEAAYQREVRRRRADPAAPPPHPACRRAANEAHAARLGRPAAEAGAAELGQLWPCECPRTLPDLESTLVYVHGYLWVPALGWVHE